MRPLTFAERLLVAAGGLLCALAATAMFYAPVR